MNQVFSYNNKNIKVFGTPEDPWFCGNDVATILGYARATKAVDTHVDDEDKQRLSLILAKVPNRDLDKKFSPHEKRMIYINESGLYALILKSTLPSSKQFKRWVTAEVLPSIRKQGYYLDNSLNEESIKKLQTQLEETKKELEVMKRKVKICTTYIDSFDELQKNQIFYIATTASYAKDNQFKFGGISNKKDLVARLRSYNTGRPESDLYYYCKLIPCHNYKLIEDKIHSLLCQLKDKKNSRKEVLVMRYDVLIEMIEYLADNYNKEVDMVNDNCKRYFSQTIHNTPIIPLPLVLDDYIEVCVVRNGEENKEKIDVSKLSDDEVAKLITDIVELCAKRVNPTYELMRDKDSVQLNLLWKDLSSSLQVYKGYTATMWRKKFKEWFSRIVPNKLLIKGIAVHK